VKRYYKIVIRPFDKSAHLYIEEELEGHYIGDETYVLDTDMSGDQVERDIHAAENVEVVEIRQDEFERLPPLKNRLNSIGRKIRTEALRSVGTDCPTPTLYHYTSPAGLIGILRDGRLWATSIRHFEDKTELLYAERIFEQVLDEITERYPNSVQSRLAAACRIEPYPAPSRGPLSPRSGKRATWLNKVLDMYVACFSTCNDSLNQWEKYACRGSGFAIGFDRRELETVIQQANGGGFAAAGSFNLVPVRYSSNTQKRELRHIFEQCSSAISATAPPPDIDLCANEIVNALALHANLFKDQIFEREKEWRIIIETLPGRSDLCFRSSADKVIPYMKTPKLPVDSITIGAAMDQEASDAGVRALLDTKRHNKVKISGANLLISLVDLPR
jgi:hypothetical protein